MDKDKNKKKLILLIEDEEIMVNLLQRKLEKSGYLVKSAGDGEAGLKLVYDLEPDLVLLDMMLPKMNGFDVLSKLYEAKTVPKLPVIIISNSGQPIELERAMKMGIKDYLIKVNFDPNEVVQKVMNVLDIESPPISKEPRDHGILEAFGSEPKANLLIVEDDQFLVDLLERKFAQENYKIFKAANEEQAMATLSQNKIDAILLDIVLPGTDGFILLSQFKSDSRFKNIPVIIISNLGRDEEIKRGIDAGAADYIIKAHATPKEIIEKVESWIKK